MDTPRPTALSLHGGCGIPQGHRGRGLPDRGDEFPSNGVGIQRDNSRQARPGLWLLTRSNLYRSSWTGAAPECRLERIGLLRCAAVPLYLDGRIAHELRYGAQGIA